MRIISAAASSFDEVRTFYHALIDAMGTSPFPFGWIKDVYPTPEFLRDSLAEGNLYLGLEDDGIKAAMVLNQLCNEGYRQASWGAEADEHEVMVIHALGVHPAFSQQGRAKEMVHEALRIARDAGMRAVRLDVLKGNLPAERLYTGLGFDDRGTVSMYYDDTGWTDFLLFEYGL